MANRERPTAQRAGEGSSLCQKPPQTALRANAPDGRRHRYALAHECFTPLHLASAATISLVGLTESSVIVREFAWNIPSDLSGLEWA